MPSLRYRNKKILFSHRPPHAGLLDRRSATKKLMCYLLTYLNPMTRGTPNLGTWGFCCGRGCPGRARPRPWGWPRRAWSRPCSMRYHGRPTAKCKSAALVPPPPPSSLLPSWDDCSPPSPVCSPSPSASLGGLVCCRCLLEGGTVSSLLSVWSRSERWPVCARVMLRYTKFTFTL